MTIQSSCLVCTQCGNGSFYIGYDAILCFYCKAKYKKSNFVGVVFNNGHSQEVKELPKPFVRGLT